MKVLRRAWLHLGCSMLVLASAAALAAGAGTVTHLSGTLSVQRPDGSVRILSVNSEVRAGDVLTSQRDSYAQIRFTDGATMTMRPNTQLKIEEYRFIRERPHEDRTFLRLIRGGLRTVTGLVGKRGNPDAYQLGTSTATVGIRGSSGDTLDCTWGCEGVTGTSHNLAPGVYHTTHTGTYIMRNAAGSQVVEIGQFGFARDRNTPPTLLRGDPGLNLIPWPSPVRLTGGGSAVECIVR